MTDAEGPILRDRLKNKRIWLGVFAIGVAFRLFVFAYTAAFPIANEDGAATSPLHIQTGTDILFYRNSMEEYAGSSIKDLLSRFGGYYGLGSDDGGRSDPTLLTNLSTGNLDYFWAGWDDPVSLANLRHGNIQYFLAPPVFPLLMAAFSYEEDNSLPLAVTYLLFSIAILAIWLYWLNQRNLSPFWLLTFALLPNPVWFTISITSDLPFALWFAAFFMTYIYLRQHMRRVPRVALWVLFLLLCLLTRPNGVAALLFVVVDLAIIGFGRASRRQLIIFAFVFGPAAAVAAIAMAPQFLIFARHGFLIEYFGLTQADYLVGIFDDLPRPLDLAASWTALVAAKMLYFSGLRPSYGDLSLSKLILRSASGLILLPGLVAVFLRASFQEKLLVFIYIVPIFLGAAQDRYNLAIQPILFFWGATTLSAVGSWFILKTRATLSRDTSR